MNNPTTKTVAAVIAAATLIVAQAAVAQSSTRVADRVSPASDTTFVVPLGIAALAGIILLMASSGSASDKPQSN